jgi:hypothetical protein
MREGRGILEHVLCRGGERETTIGRRRKGSLRITFLVADREAGIARNR